MARKIPRWSVVLASLVALYAALGFFLVPWVLKSQLEKKLPAILHWPATVREVRFNPFDIALVIHGFSLREKDGSNFVSFEELKVDLAFLRLLTGKIRFEEISLQKPAVDVAVLKNGSLNFADLLEGGEEKKKSDQPPPAITIDRLRIDDGSIGVTDLTRATPVRLKVAPLQLHLDNFSTEPAKDSPYSFTARMDPATTLRWQGDLSVNPLRSSGTLSIESVALVAFAPYSEDQVRLKLTGGLLTLRGKYRLDATTSPLIFQLDDGLAELDGLRLDGPGDRGALIEIAKLAAHGIRFDLAKKSASLDEVALEGGRLSVRREKDASLELQSLAKAPAGAKAAESAPPASAPAAAKSEPFHTALKVFKIAGLRVDFEDLVPPGGARVNLSPIDLSVGPLEWPTEAAIPLSLSVGINERGLFTIKGSARPDGAAEVDVGLSKIALAWGQPWVNQSSNAQIQGTFTLLGHVKYAAGKPAKTSFAGALSVDGLSVFAPGHPKEVVGVERFALEKLTATLPPTSVRIERVLLRGLRARVQKNADKTTTLDALSKHPRAPGPEQPLDADAKPAEKPAATTAEKKPEPAPSGDRYSVGSFVLENGALEYGDKTVTPAFSVKITQLAGKAAPLAYPVMAKTHLDFSAKVDAAPWKLLGDVEPKGVQKADLNATMTMKGWDLVPTTGYSLRGAGYPVEKGKFSLDLRYKVVDKKIDGENVVVIDQLTLGDHQDVPGATGLPVKLALAILTDRNGTLTVDLPVSGDLDDPSFSFGRMIWTTVKNLLVKVATSPFALLGSLAGSNDDLSSVEFAAGSSDLDAKEIEKLKKLGKVLVDRPALKVEIAGRVDPRTDGEVLRRDKLEERLEAARKAALPAGAKEKPVDPAERERRIRADWSQVQAQAGKMVDPKGLPTLEVMTAELIAHEQITPEELAELAEDRADEAQAKLLEVEGLAPERVFVTAPKIDPSAEGARAAAMSLK